MRLVYLSGPITAAQGFTVEQNVESALAIYFALIERGVNAFCPHISALDPRAFLIDYERWIAYDFAIINVCTHMLMLPRWEMSKGACREREYAELLGKIVLYDMPELV